MKKNLTVLEKFESNKVEYKEAKEALPQSVWKTISAFANTKGGIIVLGIKQDQNNQRIFKQGVKKPQKIVDDFVSTVSEKFNFCPVVEPEIVKEEDKSFILIYVEKAFRYEKPIYLKDAGPLKGGYKRIGSVDQKLTDKDLQRFFQERLHSPDAQVLKETKITDIDKHALSIYRNLRTIQKNDAKELFLKDKDLLKAYNLLSPEGKHLTVAGILLFGKSSIVKRHFPHFRIDIIRIKGVEWGKDKDPFLSQDFYGNILSLRSRILDTVDKFFLLLLN